MFACLYTGNMVLSAKGQCSSNHSCRHLQGVELVAQIRRPHHTAVHVLYRTRLSSALLPLGS